MVQISGIANVYSQSLILSFLGKRCKRMWNAVLDNFYVSNYKAYTHVWCEETLNLCQTQTQVQSFPLTNFEVFPEHEMPF